MYCFYIKTLHIIRYENYFKNKTPKKGDRELRVSMGLTDKPKTAKNLVDSRKN